MKLLAAIVMLSFSLSLCGLTERFSSKNNSNSSNSSSSNSNKSSSTSSSDPDVAEPEMTAAQQATLEGGQTAAFEGKGIRFTVPAKWTNQSTTADNFLWKSPGTWDAGFVSVAISSMGADFPVETSLKAMYDQNATRKQSGELMSYRWLSLDGVKGIEELEAEKSGKEDPRRLLWRGYRKYNGLNQLITIILNSQSQHFAKHDDTLHAILYSTKIEKE